MALRRGRVVSRNEYFSLTGAGFPGPILTAWHGTMIHPGRVRRARCDSANVNGCGSEACETIGTAAAVTGAVRSWR
jgi:hypothetical protein